MDKLKSLLSGTSHETNSSAVSEDTSTTQTHTPHGGLTGEGSHFGSTKDQTASGLPGSQSTTTSNPLSNTTNVPSSTSSSTPAYTPSKGLTGEGSHLGQADATSSQMPGSWDEDTTQTTGSGTGNTIPGESQERQFPLSSTTGTTQSGDTQPSLGRDATAAGTTGVLGQGVRHEHGTHGQGTAYNNTLAGSNSGTGERLSQDIGQDPYNQGTTTSKAHLGRDAAAVGGVGAVGEGLHHHNKEQNLASNTTGSSLTSGGGPTYNNTALGSNTSTGERVGQDTSAGSSGHHLGRDAAVVGAGGAVAEGIHHHHRQNETNVPSTGTGYTDSTSNTGVGSNTGSGYTGATSNAGIGSNTGGPGYADSSSTGPHSSNTANLLDPRVNTRGPQEDAISHDPKHGGGAENADESHLGRDATIGAGALGAGALGKHEYDEHKNAGVDSRLGSSARGSSGVGSSGVNDPTNSSHHHGRDAGIGAGALGAGALGKHEYDEHKNTGTNSGVDSSGVGSTGTGSTAAPISDRSTGLRNTTTDANTGVKETTNSSHHYGRDAAVGAGALGAGALGKHEYDSHQTGATNSSGTGSTTIPTTALPGPAPNTAGPHSKDWLNKLDPRVDAHPAPPELPGVSKMYGSETGTSGSAKEGHHLGRDAAVAGGAGGVAYEAEKHHKHDKDLTQEERDAKREHKHELKEEKREHKQELKEEKREHKQELKEEKKNHAEEKKDHHLGRDTAVAGGIGGAAYEAEKHHHNKDTTLNEGKDSHLGRDAAVAGGTGSAAGGGTTMWDKLHNTSTETNQPQGSVHSGTLAGTGTGYSDNTGTSTTGHSTGENHYGRDAAIGGGALGAAGLASHEHNKHESAPTADVARGTHQGNVSGAGSSTYDPDFARAELARIQAGKSDGHAGVIPVTAEGNNSMNIAKSDGTTHHYARDGALAGGAVGAGGLAEHEYKKHEGVGNSSTVGSTGTSSALGQHGQAAGTDHHYGRDAAVGAGALGAGGLAAHEHNRHENAPSSGIAQSSSTGYSPTTGTTSSSTGPSSNLGHSGQNTSEATSKDHHYGRDAAVVGGVGGAAYEADKHHKHDKDLAAAEKEAKKEHKHELKEERKEHKQEVKEEKKEHKHGFLSFLHRDKSKKYSKEEEDDFERQEKDHKGRDTALGAGAVGAAGYEAEKHHHADTNKPLPSAPGSNDAASTTAIHHGQAGDSNLGTGNYGQGASNDQYDNSLGQNTSSHTRRDAALGGLGGAGVGYGAGGMNEQRGLEKQGLGQHDSIDSNSDIVQEGRNRLHKDPPSNHPAAQQYQSGTGEGHVPTSGSQREGLLSEGKNDIDDGTGVAGSHSTGRNNY